MGEGEESEIEGELKRKKHGRGRGRGSRRENFFLKEMGEGEGVRGRVK
jgi:hypothetical protein